MAKRTTKPESGSHASVNDAPAGRVERAGRSGSVHGSVHTKVAELIEAMEQIAPIHLAEPWDNVGLLLGSPDEHLHGPVLLCIDLTHDVLDEARALGSTTIIAYHPPIFHAFKQLTSRDPGQALILRAARAGVSLYSPHTALDAAPGGLCDWLADCALGTLTKTKAGTSHADRRALSPSPHQPESQQFKVVTFVPHGDLDTVRQALATAGAGRIGNYEVCSFACEGDGTFYGNEHSSPAIGPGGRLETSKEARLEMVCSKRSLALAIATLKQFHPYEEPAVDVYPLAPTMLREIGVGRRLVLDKPASLQDIAARIKGALGVAHVELAVATDKPISCIGVCPGAGAALMDAAMAENCELFLTGEMKHHDILAAVRRGMSVMLAGHTRTERPYLRTLATRLKILLPEAKFEVSCEDRDPLVTV